MYIGYSPPSNEQELKALHKILLGAAHLTSIHANNPVKGLFLAHEHLPEELQAEITINKSNGVDDFLAEVAGTRNDQQMKATDEAILSGNDSFTSITGPPGTSKTAIAIALTTPCHPK